MKNLIPNMFLIMVMLFGAVSLSYGAVLNVPDQYATIQAAVNAASEGDAIMVDGGTYSGVVVTKSLEINGGGAVIDGSLANVSFGFLLRGADGSKVEHFTFKNVLFGVMVNGSDDVTVSHNTMGDETLAQGITIGTLRGVGSKRALISHNVINDFQLAPKGFGGVGIVASESENAMVKHNKVITQDKARRTGGGYIYGLAILSSRGTMTSQNDIRMAYGQVLTNAVFIDAESTGTVLSFNDLRGTFYDFTDDRNYPDLGPSVETTVQRNFSDGPEITASNRGEGHTDIRPSKLLPHGNVVIEFTE